MTRPAVSILMPVKIRASVERLWLEEAIASCRAQTEPDWELIVVDDHSDPAYGIEDLFPEEGRLIIHSLVDGKHGASAARNAAARLARAELILPLDADDRLGPGTLRAYLKAWTGEGFLYPSVTLFGDNAGTVTVPPEPYDFEKLIHVTYLLVGNLHLKRDWERAGGWRTDMAVAFEDWEYWIHLGELAVCGKPVPEALYEYRRNPQGRIAAIRANPLLTDEALRTMKAAHAPLYQGVRPMACCGGRGTSNVPAPTFAGPTSKDLENIPGAAEGLVRLRYRLGNQALTPWYGPVTNTTYIFGAGKPVSYVDVRDAAKMVTLHESRQQVFEIIPNVYAPSRPGSELPAAPVATVSGEESVALRAVAPEPAPEPRFPADSHGSTGSLSEEPAPTPGAGGPARKTARKTGKAKP